MFVNLLRLAIIFFTFGTVDILDSYTLYSIDNIAYEDLSYRDIFQNYTEGITLPNGVRTFEITGNYLIQRVKKYTLQASDVIALNTINTQVDIVAISIDEFQLFENWEFINYGYVIFDNIPYKNFENDINNEYTFYYYYIPPLSVNALNYVIPKGTYVSLSEAQDDLKDTIIYYQLDEPIVLHTFNNPPTQDQLDEMLDYYLDNKDNPSYEYTFKILGIEHLILYTTSMLFWFYSLKLLRKAVK